MDPLRFRDDEYLRRQILSQQAMGLTTGLSSGQSFFTLESLEGAAGLKPGPLTYLPPHSASARQDALFDVSRETLEASTRLLAAEREALLRNLPSESVDYSRARLLAAERDALLRNLHGKSGDVLPERDALFRNMHGKGGDILPGDRQIRLLEAERAGDLWPGDVRLRLLETEREALLRNFSGELRAKAFPDIDTRLMGLSEHRNHADRHILGSGVDARHLHLQPYGDDVLTSHHPLSGNLSLLAPERAPPSELHMRARGGPLPYLPAGALVSGSQVHNIGRRVISGVRSTNFQVQKQVERSRQVPVNSSHLAQQNQARLTKGPSNKVKQLPEESEGWCAICKVQCPSAKNLVGHLAGKRHKAELEKLQGGGGDSKDQSIVKEEPSSKAVPLGEVSDERRKKEGDGKVVPLGGDAIEAKRKRDNNGVNGVQGTKRAKVAEAGVGSQMVGAAKTVTGTKAKNVASNPTHRFCKICNIFTTSQKNMDTHLKGKRHAERVKELKEELKNSV